MRQFEVGVLHKPGGRVAEPGEPRLLSHIPYRYPDRIERTPLRLPIHDRYYVDRHSIVVGRLPRHGSGDDLPRHTPPLRIKGRLVIQRPIRAGHQQIDPCCRYGIQKLIHQRPHLRSQIIQRPTHQILPVLCADLSPTPNQYLASSSLVEATAKARRASTPSIPLAVSTALCASSMTRENFLSSSTTLSNCLPGWWSSGFTLSS